MKPIGTPDLPGLAELPTSEVRELSANDLIDLFGCGTAWALTSSELQT
ncbi:MAG: hypothetical protein AAB676_14835 [Verrucomicrobiota bacterium]